jgi:hypothetical protein
MTLSKSLKIIFSVILLTFLSLNKANASCPYSGSSYSRKESRKCPTALPLQNELDKYIGLNWQSECIDGRDHSNPWLKCSYTETTCNNKKYTRRNGICSYIDKKRKVLYSWKVIDPKFYQGTIENFDARRPYTQLRCSVNMKGPYFVEHSGTFDLYDYGSTLYSKGRINDMRSDSLYLSNENKDYSYFIEYSKGIASYELCAKASGRCNSSDIDLKILSDFDLEHNFYYDYGTEVDLKDSPVDEVVAIKLKCWGLQYPRGF